MGWLGHHLNVGAEEEEEEGDRGGREERERHAVDEMGDKRRCLREHSCVHAACVRRAVRRQRGMLGRWSSCGHRAEVRAEGDGLSLCLCCCCWVRASGQATRLPGYGQLRHGLCGT